MMSINHNSQFNCGAYGISYLCFSARIMWHIFLSIPTVILPLMLSAATAATAIVFCWLFYWLRRSVLGLVTDGAVICTFRVYVVGVWFSGFGLMYIMIWIWDPFFKGAPGCWWQTDHTWCHNMIMIICELICCVIIQILLSYSAVCNEKSYDMIWKESLSCKKLVREVRVFIYEP